MEANTLPVATTRLARDINRRLVLNLIREHQPISRADLSRRSRLQRSTVSIITEQLIAERWVTSGACGNVPRGRKPVFLHFNGGRAGIIGVDIRPGETSIVLSDLEMRILMEETMPTSRDPALFVARLGERCRRMMGLYPHIAVEEIGLVLPGRVTPAPKPAVYAPSLNWSGIELQHQLEYATGLKVHLENVANACALAEVWTRHRQENIRNLIVVVVAENIEVGMIFNGQLVRGARGMAGQFGHLLVEPGGLACACGKTGCFDACASNAAAARYLAEAIGAAAGAGNAGELQFASILALAENGHRGAVQALERMAQALGTGLAIIIGGMAPEMVVVVGEMTRAWDRLGLVVNAGIAARLKLKTATRVVPSAFGPNAQLRGALALVLQRYFGTP